MIRSLAYAGFTSPAADAWRSFGPDVLATPLAADGPDGAVRLRVDDAAWRVAIHPGPSDGVAYLGWDTGDAAGFEKAVTRAEAHGFAVRPEQSSGDARPAAVVASFVDPFGFRHELSHGLATGVPFEPARPMGGFVTGEQGLGHVVLFVPELPAAETFLCDALGMRPSDTITAGRTTIRFFHCMGRAARHHTVAITAVPGMVGLHHLMVEVATLDDVGVALDRAEELECSIAMGLGRHPNDLMTSFYVRTPSGFEVEYGTGGVVVDDQTWDPVAAYDRQSLWGHRPPASGRLIPGILRPFEPQGATA